MCFVLTTHVYIYDYYTDTYFISLIHMHYISTECTKIVLTFQMLSQILYTHISTYKIFVYVVYIMSFEVETTHSWNSALVHKPR